MAACTLVNILSTSRPAPPSRLVMLAVPDAVMVSLPSPVMMLLVPPLTEIESSPAPFSILFNPPETETALIPALAYMVLFQPSN